VTDFLQAEGLIIDRIKAEIPDVGGRVYSATDLADVRTGVKTPSVYVLYQGFSVERQRAITCKAELGQSWVVVTVGRNVRSKDGKGTREQVGPVIHQIMKSLLGWKPGDGLSELEISQTPDAFYDDNGFGFFPVVFNTKLII